MTKEEIEFLSESNKIEGIYDDDSLVQAQLAWEYLMKQDTITPRVILKTHKILMLNSNLLPQYKGHFRDCPVYIGGREALPWIMVPGDIKEWCVAMNAPPILRFGIDLHIEYEQIHPFVDGNGRTGRMFWNWQRIKLGLPIKIVHEGQEQMEYYKLFK